MLKKLTARHRDIIRRLLVAETPGEICLELGMSESYLSVLQADPIFVARLELEQAKLSERFIEQRMDAMQILEETQGDAALLCREAVVEGMVGGKEIKGDLQLKSAWDVLDRTGITGVDKKLIATASLADLVAEAYKEKHQSADGGNGNGDDQDHQNGEEPVAAQDSSSLANTGKGEATSPLLLPLPNAQLNLFGDI